LRAAVHFPPAEHLEAVVIEDEDAARSVPIRSAERGEIDAVGPAMDVCSRLYPVRAATVCGSITFTIFGFVGSGFVSMTCRREERNPGTSRYRRSTCGWGAYGQSAELHAFQPKWCTSSPAFGISTRPTTLP